MANEKNTVLESCLAKAQGLNEMVSYASDSIVSKTILDKPAGTLTLFAFDKGQKLSEHSAPYDATVQVVDGVGTITIDGKDTEVNTGELIIMPANVPHSVTANQQFKMLLIMIRTKS